MQKIVNIVNKVNSLKFFLLHGNKCYYTEARVITSKLKMIVFLHNWINITIVIQHNSISLSIRIYAV